MKRFKFNKPLVESPYPPQDTNVLWIDVDESTGKTLWIKEFKNGEWINLVSSDTGTTEIVYNEIDLGLRTPDGKKILIADRNIGANNPEEFGLYFQWGDLYGHPEIILSYPDPVTDEDGNSTDGYIFSWQTCKYTGGMYGKEMTKYTTPGSILEPIDDPTKYYMGKDWMMLPAEVAQLLLDNCDTEIIGEKGDDEALGVKLISKINGNSVVFPLSGWGIEHANHGYDSTGIYNRGAWWTSTLCDDIHNAYSFMVAADGDCWIGDPQRRTGICIRGIKVVD